MNERLIYEWLKPELVGDDWKLYGDLDDCGVYQMDAFRDGKPSMALPPLDMNTWYGEVVPKLLSEGAEVHFVTNQNNHNERHHNIYAQGCYEPFSDSDPYEALTEYLEAQ